MKYHDFYEITISVNGNVAEINPSNISFSIQDSINSLYSWVNCRLHDSVGIIQESFFTTEGIKVKLEFGTDDQINSCEYVIKDDELLTPKTAGLLNGNVEINLIHAWYNNQEIKSKAYQDRISEIISNKTKTGLVDSYNFSSIDINDTGNEDIWYQPLITDARFINNILLPNAYSNNADKCPFYAYTTCDNVFHFRRLNSMYNTKSLITFPYAIRTQEEQVNLDFISKITRWREGSGIHKDLRHRRLFKIDRNTGNLLEDEDFIYSYPATPTMKVPIVGDSNLFTGYSNLGYSEIEIGKQENILGQTFSSMKRGMFLEKFMTLVPLNMKLVSGNPVELEVYTVNEEGDNTRSTKTFSGKYIIIESEHIWNGEEDKGYSKLILGRKFVKLPSSYFVQEAFLK